MLLQPESRWSRSGMHLILGIPERTRECWGGRGGGVPMGGHEVDVEITQGRGFISSPLSVWGGVVRLKEGGTVFRLHVCHFECDAGG